MLDPPKPRRRAEPITVSLEELVPQDLFYYHQETKPRFHVAVEMVSRDEGMK